MVEPSADRIDDAINSPVVPSAWTIERTNQQPPADELADVRQQIKELEDREAALRSVILTDPETRTGNRFVAEVKDVATSRTDWAELRAAYPDLVDEYTYSVTVSRVVLSAITEDGEIVPARRRRR